MSKSRSQALEDHYARTWSKPIQRLRWERGPTNELPPSFEVLVFKRGVASMTYATSGMSDGDAKEGLELHLIAPSDTQDAGELVELLTVVAHYHLTSSRLGVGHAVNFGRPWLPGSACTYGLVSLPYLDGPSLEWMQNPSVRCLWLVPITRRELDYKKANGLEALEIELEAAQFNYSDPLRSSVV